LWLYDDNFEDISQLINSLLLFIKNAFAFSELSTNFVDNWMIEPLQAFACVL